MLRRQVMIGGLSAAAGALAHLNQAAGGSTAAQPFTDETVPELARDLAARPYQPPPGDLPRPLAGLTYDQYRAIQFDRGKALWRPERLRFQAQMFHRGFLFERRVALHEVVGGEARGLPFSRDRFIYGEQVPPMPDGDLGFAGARVLFPMNHPDRHDEVAAFLGASYFRAVARGQVYGLSARGLAIGTADAKGEEFPWFRAFWLERPAADANALVVHALLDSVSAAGAYRFVITPGDTTIMDVAARIHPRRAITTAGIAPLTSMYLHGPNDREGVDDYRPAVHDSDGLLHLTGRGEQRWRPLSNPRTLQVSSFADVNPAGFGLIQRRRAFADFQDLEADYHRRPSLWVEPLEAWGEGEVQLVEIPTAGEINDNIVAFWRPRAPLPAGQEARLNYRLHWCAVPRIGPGLAVFGETRLGAGSAPGQRRFVLDATGGRLAGGGVDDLPPDRPGTLDLWASAGTILHPTHYRNAATGGMRVTFELRPGTAQTIELGAQLADAEGALSERWLYRWTA